MNSRKIISSIAFFTILFSSSFLKADITIPRLVGDNMVLQRNIKVKIWGWADAEKVSIKFQKQKLETKADFSGKWMIQLNPLKQGGPFEMSLEGKNKIIFKNILVGDVWICSGQSNMQWSMNRTKDSLNEIKNANFPMIRLFMVKQETSMTPKSNVTSEGWKVCSPESVKEFSAVGYFFGRDLFRKYNIPIGLINTSWGGTPAESWTSATALKTIPDYAESVATHEKMNEEQKDYTKTYQERLLSWTDTIINISKSNPEADKTLFAVNVDTKDWKKTYAPGFWEKGDMPKFDGVVWFRREFDVPKEMAGKDAKLFLAKIDDMDTTWFNGVKVGYTDDYKKSRIYNVPGNLIKAGHNVIAIRILDTKYNGGIYGPVDSLKLEAGDISLPLPGVWYYKVSVDFKDAPVYPTAPNIPVKPIVLYNGMIAPIINYGIKGAIWYQGEANASRAYQYRTLLPTMIKNWRADWAEGDFPFLIVQLANYKPAMKEPAESDWAELREAQSMTAQSLPNTGIAVAIDLGDAKDIHPRNKQDVGKRLALSARKIAYGENIVYSGPTYESMLVEGDKIRIKFKNVGSGLDPRDLSYFSIAGEDRKFVWANASIDGSTVVVSNPNVKNPVAVRYAWADNPEGANLYNKEELPASPFRTDNWPGITVGKK